ncbi:MAG TPA: hypothetical protein VJX72_11650 [Candidatus Acidoferrum sp.]|nr:hypothetical protein [Candidatus Acidoferrum sp.]
MIRRLLSRLISAAVLAVLLGAVVHFDYVRWNRRGREAFLKYQDHRYDTSMATPRTFLKTLGQGLSVIILIIGLYEGMSLTFSMLLRDFLPGRPMGPQKEGS